MAPAAGMLMEVRRLLDEGAFRASRAQRFCTGAADCCRFRLTGETPHVTLGEAWVAWKAWRASGRTRLELPPDGSCPFLSGQGRCMIYIDAALGGDGAARLPEAVERLSRFGRTRNRGKR